MLSPKRDGVLCENGIEWHRAQGEQVADKGEIIRRQKYKAVGVDEQIEAGGGGCRFILGGSGVSKRNI